MVRFRHKGCQNEVIRDVGVTPLADDPIMRSSEWVKPHGTHPVVGSDRVAVCPDCLRFVCIHPRELEPINEEILSHETQHETEVTP